jgi:peptidoglycan/LPS O-acetylase OafA/YrhL
MGLEAQFYLLFPVLVWGWNRYRWRALWAAVFASVFYRAGVDAVLGNQPGPERFLWTITFLGRWMQFVTGMMVSYLLVSLSSPAVERIVRWRYGFLAAGGGLVWWGLDPVVAEVPWVPARDLLLSAGYGLLLLVLLMAPWRLKTVFSAGVLGWLGVFSYSFFLIHQPTAWYFMEWVRKRSGVSGAPQVLFGLSVGLVVTAAVAWVFAWIFEGAAVRRRLWVR